MPKINDLIKPISGYHPIEASTLPRPPIDGLVQDSNMNPYMRCPVPQIGNASQDTLNQYDRKGTIPQYRIFLRQ